MYDIINVPSPCMTPFTYSSYNDAEHLLVSLIIMTDPLLCESIDQFKNQHLKLKLGCSLAGFNMRARRLARSAGRSHKVTTGAFTRTSHGNSAQNAQSTHNERTAISVQTFVRHKRC